MTLEQRFTHILAKKLQGDDTTSDVAALSKDELFQFKEWVAKKKEEAQEKIWKKKQTERAAKPNAEEEIIFNAGE